MTVLKILFKQVRNLKNILNTFTEILYKTGKVKQTMKYTNSYNMCIN